jgi:acetyl esterase/lipase
MRFEERMDPELAPGLEIYKQLGFERQELDAEAIVSLRAQVAQVFSAMSSQAPPTEGVAKEDRMVPGPDGGPELHVRVYRPGGAEATTPCLYWIHGGGMVMGDLDQDDMACEAYAKQLGCVVVAPEYRLAPENPHPAPVEDCYAGLLWTAAHAEELGIDPERIAVGGSSAGGGLSASVALLARDREGPPIAMQALVYPMLDDRGITASSREFSGILSWSREQNQSGWRALLEGREGADDVSPYAAAARAEDLSGLPPALVQACELDTLRDEAIEYAGRLLAAGVSTELQVYPGTYHGSDWFAPEAAVSGRMLEDRVRALGRLSR